MPLENFLSLFLVLGFTEGDFQAFVKVVDNFCVLNNFMHNEPSEIQVIIEQLVADKLLNGFNGTEVLG